MRISTGHYVLLTFALSLSDKSDGLHPDMVCLMKDSNEQIVDKLVSDLINDSELTDDYAKSLLKHVKQLQASSPTNINGNPEISDIDAKPTDSPSTKGSLLDRGIRYIKGLFGVLDSKPQEEKIEPKQATNTVPSPEDEAIMDDIKKYFDGAVENRGAFEKIMKYIISYVHRNVHFWLFTKDQKGYQILQFGNVTSVDKSEFKSTRKTVLLIHGWVNSGNNHFAHSMVKAFDKYGDYNIISVDWSEMAYSFYTTSRIAVNFIGPYVAKMVDFLALKHELKAEDLHILGHSLGAHIAGIAGMFIKSGKVGRITGFDPASPLFGDDQKYRLDASDGKFVDVIHTSIFGMSDAIGNMDFYPNGGGPSQPGCGFDIAICPHRRSYQYFIASMTDDKFLAFPCDSWDSFTVGNCSSQYVRMGIHAPSRRSGKFYLRTSGDPPYALGIKTLNPPNDSISLQASPRK